MTVVMDRRHYARSFMKMRLEIKTHDLLLQGSPLILPFFGTQTPQMMTAHLQANTLSSLLSSQVDNYAWS